MLILSRKPGENIVIDGRIIVKIMRLDGDLVKIGIEAPAEVPVHRQEVYDEIQKVNRESLTDNRPKVPRIAPGKLPAPPAAARQPALSTKGA
ncbi:MAG TPA: carbon storage regulator CsrA [Verrucomicrobiae bacterium]|jgi:carbon storage regulator|nr:carbon storage regulator CsrA [Verrucomicrobiae bacterium]